MVNLAIRQFYPSKNTEINRVNKMCLALKNGRGGRNDDEKSTINSAQFLNINLNYGVYIIVIYYRTGGQYETQKKAVYVKRHLRFEIC